MHVANYTACNDISFISIYITIKPLYPIDITILLCYSAHMLFFQSACIR